jgi:hypothetical protein
MTAPKNENIGALEQAIRSNHGCSASYLNVQFVREESHGQLVWEGDVYLFEVDHPDASICFAWSSPIEGSKGKRIGTAPKKPPIGSAQDAVRASIVADYHRRS